MVTVTRDTPRATAVLRGARAITMKGNEIIKNADIVVRDNRIVAIGARGSVQVPADARVIDVAGKTILPGYVDTHYHPQWLTPQIHNTRAGSISRRLPMARRRRAIRRRRPPTS